MTAPAFAPAQDSLYLTLCGRALDHRAPRPILGDATADEVVRALGYDVARQPHARTGMRDIALRARRIDDVVRRFVRAHPDAVVLDLGAGLDGRRERVAPPAGVDWYDIDVAEVTALRDRVLPARARGRSTAIDLDAAVPGDGIPTDRPVVAVADGLLAFLPQDRFVALLAGLVTRFPFGEVAFNGYTRFHVWALHHYGGTRGIADAVVNPGFDDPRAPERWVPGLRLVEEILLTRDPEVAAYPTALRWFTRLAGRSRAVSRRGTTVLRYGFGVAS